MDRALAYEANGCWFDPSRRYHFPSQGLFPVFLIIIAFTIIAAIMVSEAAIMVSEYETWMYARRQAEAEQALLDDLHSDTPQQKSL